MRWNRRAGRKLDGGAVAEVHHVPVDRIPVAVAGPGAVEGDRHRRRAGAGGGGQHRLRCAVGGAGMRRQRVVDRLHVERAEAGGVVPAGRGRVAAVGADQRVEEAGGARQRAAGRVERIEHRRGEAVAVAMRSLQSGPHAHRQRRRQAGTDHALMAPGNHRVRR